MVYFLPTNYYLHLHMTPMFYYEFYLLLFFFCLILILLAFFIFILIQIFNTRFWQNSQTQSIYECGFLPFEEARVRFEPKFYMIALSFIIFDLEICFIFPWLLVFSNTAEIFFLYFFVFLLLVLFGILYEWKNGIFDWNQQ
jgi:NADH:ubiquinone oxidoreductase subunit 3 (subunit A)